MHFIVYVKRDKSFKWRGGKGGGGGGGGGGITSDITCPVIKIVKIPRTGERSYVYVM